MNSNKIHIKSRTPAFIVKGAVFLILMMISLACALLPYLAGVTDGSMNLIRAAGWIVFAVTTAFFIYLVVNEIRPRDAMILDSRGFTENNHLLGASVEWTNVASVGIYGTKENPVFGITFENNDIVINGLRKRAADEMRVNIENNLPSVLISRNEVAVSLKELRDTFNRFIRESRVLKDTAPVKQKTNPFTTEDVLRAFGKIPQEKPAGEKTIVAPEPVKDDTPKFVEVNDGSQPAEKHSGSDFYSALFEDDNSEPEVPSGDTIVVRDRPAVKEEPAVSDTVVFSEKPEPEAPAEEVPEVKERETKPEEQPDIGDFEEYDLPDDLKAILSGKRSEKINKIEKMLE
ncbi:MAG: hypothetical protein J5793_01325, partial [Clostridia bacterium]|nr:hypothetical protein [Clostridia bacterium]